MKHKMNGMRFKELNKSNMKEIDKIISDVFIAGINIDLDLAVVAGYINGGADAKLLIWQVLEEVLDLK